MIGFNGPQLSRNRIAGTRATRFWFDSAAVLRRLDAAKRRELSRFGYLVMRNARESIRKRKRNSRPGQPPSNRTGLLKSFIFYAYNPDSRSVVIGPAKLPAARDNVPELLEYGGITAGRRMRRPVRIRPRPYMEPAFDRQVEKRAAEMWRNSL